MHLDRRRRYALDGAIDTPLGRRSSHRPVVTAIVAPHVLLDIALHLRLRGRRCPHCRHRVWSALTDWRALVRTFTMHLAIARPTH